MPIAKSHKPLAKHQTSLALLFLLACCILLLAGCGTKKEQDQEQDFLDKWQEEAEESRGHSPRIKSREMLELDQMDPDMAQEQKEPPKKKLPTDKVTLHLREAPVRSVLRAMSRAADQNMIVNQSVSGQMSVDLEEVPWNHAFKGILDSQGLTYSWQGDVLRIKSRQDLQNSVELSNLQEELRQKKRESESYAPLQNQIIKVNFADPEKLAESLNKFLSRDQEGDTRGHIEVNPENNSLILQATRKDLTRMERMIEHLDRPRSQILIEANIVEATRNTAKELGIRWSGRYVTPTDFEDQVGTGDLLRDEAGFTGDMDLSMISARLPGSILYSQLQTLESEGKVNILSSPSITTMDNQMAFTDHGEKVPYETVDEDGDRNVQFEDASLRLEVVPSLIDGEHMMMDIKVLKDEVDFTRDVQGNPVIRTKETETNLVVRDGETIVISGLSKQTVSDRERGILGLRQLPGLGWLFKDQNLDDEMEEFMIFITPSILSPQGES